MRLKICRTYTNSFSVFILRFWWTSWILWGIADIEEMITQHWIRDFDQKIWYYSLSWVKNIRSCIMMPIIHTERSIARQRKQWKSKT